MFKKDNLVWLYLIGIVVLLILVFLAGREYILPWVAGDRGLEIETGFVYTDPPPNQVAESIDYRMLVETNIGSFTIDLYERSAPRNVSNLIFLAREGYYEGTYFHRLVPDLFVHGGDRNSLNDDPADDGFGGPGYLVRDEINWDSYGLSSARREQLAAAGYQSLPTVSSQPMGEYSVAMASTAPDANGSQFFILLADASDQRVDQLVGYHTVVGRVIRGQEVVDEFRSIEVDATDTLVPRPIFRVRIDSVQIVEVSLD